MLRARRAGVLVIPTHLFKMISPTRIPWTIPQILHAHSHVRETHTVSEAKF